MLLNNRIFHLSICLIPFLMCLCLTVSAGTISGLATDEVTSFPISQLDFNLYDADWTFIEIDADSDGAGNYTFFNLPAGAYYIKAIPIYPQHFRPEYWNNSFDRSGAQLIELQEGENKTGIDFSMTQGYFIGGKVLDTQAVGIFGLDINAYDADWNKLDVDTETDSFGKYFIGGLPSGSYFIMANPDYPQPYLEQYYNHSNGPVNATIVELVAPNDTIGINFSLDVGCYAEGFVRDLTTQLPISGIAMRAYNQYGTKMRIEGRSKSDGHYSLGPYKPGAYFVRADPTYPKGYPDQYFDGAYLLDDAQLVNLMPPKPITGIDFNLPLGSYIRGYIKDLNSTNPLDDIKIKFYDSDWKLCELATCRSRNDGSYLSGALRPGMHFAKAVPIYPQPYIDEYYPNAIEKSDAVALNIIPGQEISDISFDLAKGGYILGTVRDQTSGDPLFDIDIDIYDANLNWVSYSDHTNHSGTYLLGALPFGDYFVSSDPESDPGYRPEFYNDVFWPDQASMITLTSSSNIENIDFDLIIGGKVTGHVTDDVTDLGIAEVEIEVYSQDHSLVPVRIVSSSSDGSFTSYGMQSGSYYFLARAPNHFNYTSEYYNEASSFETATLVNVIEGNLTSGINFTLHYTGAPTPPPPTLGVSIEMPDNMFHHGDLFYVNARVTNPGTSLGSLPLFVVLDVYGDYFFWPRWVHYSPPLYTEIDFQYMNVDSGVQIVSILPLFEWPRIEGPDVTGLFFYGALLNTDLTSITGELGQFEFGYGD